MKIFIKKILLIIFMFLSVSFYTSDTNFIKNEKGFYIGDTKEKNNRKIALKFDNDSVKWIIIRDRYDQKANIVLITRGYYGYKISTLEKVKTDKYFLGKNDTITFNFSNYRKAIIICNDRSLRNIKLFIVNDVPKQYYIVKEIKLKYVNEILIKK
jgi:hypothetical protein